jgi:hypothetical protein
MKKVIGSIHSIHVGDNEDMSKKSTQSIAIELNGFPNDKHQGYSRTAFEGESVPEGTIRRNDRQWSAVSIEELKEIEELMQLSTPLLPSVLGANLCFQGIPDFSQLPKGTQLFFPSGAVLMVEEYNPPCQYMSEQIAKTYSKINGEEVKNTDFSKAARKLRGLVGVIDVEGEIHCDDEVTVKILNPRSISNFLNRK